MFKPHNLSIKEYIIKKMAISLNMPEKDIDKVISHQFNSVNDAFRKVNSIEISGFGKFVILPVKTRKMLEKAQSKIRMFTSKLNKEGISEAERQSLMNKINNTLVQEKQYKEKLEKHERNIRISETDTKSDT